MMDAEGHEVEILDSMRFTSVQASSGLTVAVKVHPFDFDLIA